MSAFRQAAQWRQACRSGARDLPDLDGRSWPYYSRASPGDLDRAVVVLGGDNHVSANNLLGLGKGSIRYAGRCQDSAPRLELTSHIHDASLELVLPGVE